MTSLDITLVLIFSCVTGSTCLDICEDTITEQNWVNATDSSGNFIEKLTSCARLVACYPNLCDRLSHPGGRCCLSCKAVGESTCLNKPSPCLPLFLIKNGDEENKIPVHSCTDIVKDYSDLCAKDSFGGKGNACCKACNEAPNPAKDPPCIDSTTWKTGKGNRAKTCAQLNKKANKMKRCCKKNKQGQGTSLRCQAACCSSCAKYV